MGNILTKRKGAEGGRGAKKSTSCGWCDKKIAPEDNTNGILDSISGRSTRVKKLPPRKKTGAENDNEVRGICKKHATWAPTVQPSPKNLDNLFSVTPVHNLEGSTSDSSVKNDLSGTHLLEDINDGPRKVGEGMRRVKEFVLREKNDASAVETGKLNHADKYKPTEERPMKRPGAARNRYMQSSRYYVAPDDPRGHSMELERSSETIALDKTSSDDDSDRGTTPVEGFRQPACWERNFSSGKSCPIPMMQAKNSSKSNVFLDGGMCLEDFSSDEFETRIGTEVMQRNCLNASSPKPDRSSVAKRTGRYSDKMTRAVEMEGEHSQARRETEQEQGERTDAFGKLGFLAKLVNTKNDKENLKALYHDDGDVDESTGGSKLKVRSARSRSKRRPVDKLRNTNSKVLDKHSLDRKGRLPKIRHGFSPLIERNLATVRVGADRLALILPSAKSRVAQLSNDGQDVEDEIVTEDKDSDVDAPPLVFEPDKAGSDFVRSRYSTNRHPGCTGWFVGQYTSLSVCLHAICAATFQHIGEWDTMFLDDLIHVSIDYHGKLLKHFQRRPGDGADIPLEKHGVQLEMFSNHWFEMDKAKRVFDGMVQHLNPDLGPLADQLPQAITTAFSGYYFAGLLTILDDYGHNIRCMNMACIKGSDCFYYLFTPHPTDDGGKHSPDDGRASIRKFHSVDTLCQFIKEVHSQEAFFLLKPVAFTKPTTFKCPACIEDMIEKNPAMYGKPIVTTVQ